ncbi:GlnD UTP,GlnB (protein PII) uridylyltransferase [actinobacterium SCGC AAA044-D11]
MGTRERRDRSNKIDSALRVSFLQAADNYLSKPDAISLAAVGGYGRGELSPGSDLDLLILHDGSEKSKVISEFVNAFLYPLWDQGRAVDHSVRTRSETREVASEDIRVALGLLDLRHIAGNSEISSAVSSDALENWRRNAGKYLPKLRKSIQDRELRSGELAFLLEPDLKEARGGLRDINALRAIEMSGAVTVSLARVGESEALLSNVRDVLHGESLKAKDQLLLTEQDRVAAIMQFKDADELMLEVAKAARAVDYLMDLTWHRIDSSDSKGWFKKSKPQNIDKGLVILNSEITIENDYPVTSDSALGLRAAATAAQRGLPLSIDACVLLAENFLELPTPWPKEALNDLVSLIGAGTSMIRVFEALDQEGLIEKWIPEWSHVRFLPQRNVLHRHTVDRHMLETAVRAANLTRTVKRADILLVAALFHDIGKGFPDKDHSEYGEELIVPLAMRLGFDEADCAQIALLVREHLLLSAVATRRDLEDPATIAFVVDKLKDPESLQLLHALSISDGEATGKSGWSDWKAGLVANLVSRCLEAMAGIKPVSQPDLLPIEPITEDLKISIVDGPENKEQIEIEIIAKDQTGLLSAVAGLMTISRLNVRSAKTRTTDDIAIMRWLVELDANAVMPTAEKLLDQLKKALSGDLDLGRKIEERIENYRKYPGIPTPPPVVFASNDLATNATIIEVRMHDRPGILFSVARAISRFGVDIKSAIVSTLGAEAFDTLYVTDLSGQPLTGERAQLLATKVENILITHL